MVIDFARYFRYMPGKKKARKLRPYEKVQVFMDGYHKICEIYDVEPIDEVAMVYDPVIENKWGPRKITNIMHFAGIDITGAQLRPLIEAYQTFEIRVRFFSLMNTKSGDEGLHMLAHVLEPPLEVQGIAYTAQDITESGCRSIARAMVKSKSLCILELDFNSGIADLGVAGLTHYGHCPTMTKLSLRFCDIGDQGAAAIAKWLTLPDCNLKELFLNGNKIGPAGAIEIGKALASNNSLQRLDLSDNLFGFDKGALEALHDGINACKPLVYISLLSQFECPEGMGEKFLDLTTNKPLGEFVLTTRMDAFLFQNIKAAAGAGKKKILKELKKKKPVPEEEQPPESIPIPTSESKTETAPTEGETAPATETPAETNVDPEVAPRT